MRKIVRDRILKKFNNKCIRCGSTERLEVDHIIPLSRGGEHSESNFQILCKTCNLKKGRGIDFNKYFIKGNNSYIYISRDFPLKSVNPEEFKYILETKFNQLCQE